jgi:integrase
MSIERRVTKSGPAYDVRLRKPDGTSYKRTFRTKAEAQRFEAAQRTDRDRGTWIDPAGADRTFADWAAHWVATDPSKAVSTKATDASVLRSAILPALGHRTIGSITPTEIQQLVSSWASTHSPRTVRRRYAVLGAAVRADLIGRTPCRGVKLPKNAPPRTHILGPDEVRRLHQELPERYRAMLSVAVTLGLRFGEVAALRVGRLDPAHGVVHVHEALGEASGHLFTKAPTTRAGLRSPPNGQRRGLARTPPSRPGHRRIRRRRAGLPSPRRRATPPRSLPHESVGASLHPRRAGWGGLP